MSLRSTSHTTDETKLLEWELSLDAADLRSHGWYHGNITRHKAEELIHLEGDFLVRDCSSRPGDYVLSCIAKSAKLHFVINKVVMQPYTVYEKIQFTFEADAFDTLPDLITYYVGNKMPISKASGAIMARPINRNVPLSGSANLLEPIANEVRSPRSNGPCSPSIRIKSSAFLSSSSSSSSTSSASSADGLKQPSTLSQLSFDSQFDDSIPEEAPPKPTRNSTANVTCKSTKSPNTTSYNHKESLYVNNDVERNLTGSLLSNDSGVFSDVSKANDSDDLDFNSSCPRQFIEIPCEISSCINLIEFHTFLLPKDNRPLDMSAVSKIKSVLFDTGPRILANHLTKIDLMFISHLEMRRDYGFNVVSGFELITLPQGHQLRLDILDRTECFKYFVAISILTCHKESERTAIISKWIQIAIETKTAVGNLQGFAGIMLGLCLPQIQRLKNTWFSLRRHNTTEAFQFDSKLKPNFKTMLESNNPLAPNTTFPYVITNLEIIERHYSIMEEVTKAIHTESIVEAFKNLSLKFNWENSTSDYGLNIIHSHMDAGRQIIKQIDLFKKNAHIVLNEVQYEELLLDMFKTEFHLRFLWGSRGATVDSSERYTKFEQVLNLLSSKCES